MVDTKRFVSSLFDVCITLIYCPLRLLDREIVRANNYFILFEW